ncbi:MAG: periplasmic protein TonB [Verrucomicrobiota bacterium]|jgi:TonB family protein
MSSHGDTINQVFALRIIIVAALATIISPAAANAAENTTAVWSDGHTSSLTDEELMRYAISSPGPGYPEEAQRLKIAGSGLYELRIDKTGKTTEVAIVKSSGNSVLDQAARKAFTKWRFKPAVFVRIRLPVSWAAHRLN